MSISDTLTSTIMLGDGSLVNFSLGFPVIDKTHVEVYLKDNVTGNLTQQFEGADFSFDANPPTFITFVTAPSADYQVCIFRVTPNTQTTDYLNTGPFLAETYEASLDKLTMLIQDLRDKAILLAPGDAVANILPMRLNAEKVLGTSQYGELKWYNTNEATVNIDTTVPLPAGIEYGSGYFNFYTDTSTQATAGIRARSLTLFEPTDTRYVNISAPSLSQNYEIYLPQHPPITSAFMSMTTPGQMEFSYADDSTIEVSSGTVRVKDSGITRKKLKVATQRSFPNQGCTMTIASPCVVTCSGHGYTGGEEIVFMTSGALPTGITAYTPYYVKYINANTFNLSTTVGGSNVNTSGSQSGTHYVQQVVQLGDCFYGSVGGTTYSSTTSTRNTANATAHFAIRTNGNPIIFAPTGINATVSLTSANTSSAGIYGADLLWYYNGSGYAAEIYTYHMHPSAAGAYTALSSFSPTSWIFSPTNANGAGVYMFELYIAITSGGVSASCLPQFGFTVKEM